MARSARESNAAWIEDCLVLLLCVLALDRFGDYGSDQVTAPVSKPHPAAHSHSRSECTLPMHRTRMLSTNVSSGTSGLSTALYVHCPSSTSTKAKR